MQLEQWRMSNTPVDCLGRVLEKISQCDWPETRWVKRLLYV